MSSLSQASENSPESAEDALYVLANLAIWAGDFQGSRACLSELVGRRRENARQRVSPYADPIAYSVQDA